MIRPSTQSINNSATFPQKQAHHLRRQQRRRLRSSSSVRHLIWILVLVFVVVLAVFSFQRRNVVDPPMRVQEIDYPMRIQQIHYQGDVSRFPFVDTSVRSKDFYDSKDAPVLTRSALSSGAMGEQRGSQQIVLRHPPRVIRYNFDENHIVQLKNKQDRKRKHVHIGLDYRKLEDENEKGKYRTRNKKKHLNPNATCVPMDDWQTVQFLSCNNVHETNMGNVRFINCGSTRCAFQFYDVDGTAHVLKTQFFDYVDERDMEYARKDALALERLTKSPYVANIYGSCGMTQTLEYSDYGNLFDWMKLTRAKQRAIPSPVERLKFGFQMATAVADVHSINEADGVVSMTHNDICCHQFIHIDGIFKLGDFHLSTFHKKNRTSGEACKMNFLPMNSAMMKARAPEEMNGPARASREKVDVYLVGNMMYYILTRKWMFEGITTEEAIAKLRAGERSELGFEPTDPADVAIVKAINWAWNQDPDKRPKAREISQFLKTALQKIEGKSQDYIVRVPILPLPKDYDFSDLEFYKNLGTDLDGNPL